MRPSNNQLSRHRVAHAYRGPALALTALAAIAALLIAPAAWASVGLSKFEAKAQLNTIVVTWETQTEFNTSGFELYRAESASPVSWGAPIDQQVPKGGLVPATYTYPDTAVTQGVMYYYRLKELRTDGSSDWLDQLGLPSAGVGLSTATATRTATRTATASRTPYPTLTRPPTEGPMPATATRQFENSPTVPPTPSPTFGSAFNSGVPTPLPPTPVGTGYVVSPTPGALQPAPALPRVVPSLTPTVFVPTPVIETASPTATSAPLLSKPITREPKITGTPEVFEAARGDDARRPTPAAQEGVRSTNTAFALGGGALVVAVLLGATGFFLWRARR
jgi:hypothetical protein